MENPLPIHLQTDQELINRGWTCVARDGDGHVIATAFRAKDDEEAFKDALLDWFNQGYTIKNLIQT